MFWDDGGRPWVSFLRSGRATSERMANITASLQASVTVYTCRH